MIPISNQIGIKTLCRFWSLPDLNLILAEPVFSNQWGVLGSTGKLPSFVICDNTKLTIVLTI